MKLLRLIEVVVAGLLIAFLFYPLALLLKGAFWEEGAFTFHYFFLLFQDNYRIEAFVNSLSLASSVSLSAFTIALPLSIIFSRYSFRGRSLCFHLILLPLIIPPFVGALGARQLLGRFGTVNLLLMQSGILQEPLDFLKPGGLFGVFLLQTMHLFPLLFLSLTGALAQLDYSLVEAAVSVGASRWKTFANVTLPLILPASLGGILLTFVASLTDLGTPLLFENRQVIAVQIFQLLTDAQETPVSLALVVCLAIFCGTFFFLARTLSPKFTSSVSKGFQPVPIRPLRWRQAIYFYLLFSTLLLAALAPHFGVLFLSLSENWFMSPFPSSWTLAHYKELLFHPLTRNSFLISLTLSVGTVLLTSFLGFFTAYQREKRATLLSYGIDHLLILPLALPGILFAFGYLKVFTSTFLDPRGNPLPLLLIAYIVRRLPLVVNSVRGALRSFPSAMEESAWSVGASRFLTVRTIIFPQVKSSLLTGAALTGIASMLEVSESMLLALDDRFYPVSKALYALSGRPDGVPLACALSCVLIVVVLLFLSLIARGTGKSLSDIFQASSR